MPGGARVQLRPRAAILVASGQRYEAVASELGIDERTVRRWAKDEQFAAQVRAVQAEVMRRAADKLADGMAVAANVLIELLVHEDARIRMAAAKEVLCAASRVRAEMVVEDRLSRLEAQAAELADPDRSVR
jgi:predicted transcriptional regulator